MCLRFVFLLITRVAAWLRLSRREETWKTAEILILRHQLAILQRRQPRRPKLNWADRALLAALLSVIPKARRRGLWLLITPGKGVGCGCSLQCGSAGSTLPVWPRTCARVTKRLSPRSFPPCQGTCPR